MRTMVSRRWALVAALVIFGHVAPAAARSGTVIKIASLPAGVTVEVAINGVKPGTSAVAVDRMAELVLNAASMPKPDGFTADVFLDINGSKATLHLIEPGHTVPALEPGATRTHLGIAQFLPDRVTTFNAAPRSSSPFPPGWIGGGALVDSSDVDYTRNLEVFTGRIGTTTLAEERNTAIPNHFLNNTRVRGTTSALALPLNPGTGQGSRFVHHALIMFGPGGAQLDYQNQQAGSPSTEWNGDGNIWGGGYRALYSVCGDCPWFVDGSYTYSQMSVGNMTRRGPLDLDGGRLVRDEASFQWRAHSASAMIGRMNRFVYSYGGVRAANRSASLNGRVEVDFSQLAGTTAVQNVSFENDFDATTVQGVAGVQIQIPRTRLVLIVEGASDGTNSGVRAGAAFGFSLRDLVRKP